MNPIDATVLKVDKRGNEYFVAIQLEGEKYYDKFEKLRFENKPDQGWCHLWLAGFDLLPRSQSYRGTEISPLWSVAASPFED
jgi:hypothetical protein